MTKQELLELFRDCNVEDVHSACKTFLNEYFVSVQKDFSCLWVKDLMNRRLDSYDFFSNTTMQIIAELKIEYVGQLIQLTEDEILAIRKGKIRTRKALHEIYIFLEERDLDLNMKLFNWVPPKDLLDEPCDVLILPKEQ